MATTIKAMAAEGPKGEMKRWEFSLPDSLKPHEIEIEVTHCGVCHSDLSMRDNDWHMTAYPFVPGHEVVGRVGRVGEHVTMVKVGQTVGLGWYSHSCMTCRQCMSGDHNLCATAEQTIIGRHGGFADKVRCHEEWATPLPAGLDPAKAGPLFCGGITVFNPIVQFGVKPTDRVGVVGIGGLGHLALKFLNKWGCEVIAFTSSDSKREEALGLGAHRVVNSRDSNQLKSVAGSLDFIISTVNVALDWPAYINSLAPRGRLHLVGVAPDISLPVFPMVAGQRSVSGSPLGSPATTGRMIEFCGRHGIEPTTEHFPMSKANDAFEHLHSGKARYRIVLTNDL
ncbi:alcohol dehydrogenase catalytic domain-containing protein [bacterium]|nr:alcohol dehydrogenase catalytic domain-containing protein [bacterium]